MNLTPEQITRFWSHVDKSGECWLWTGTRNNLGYGRAKINGKMELVHRVAWEIEHGPIPPGKSVCHDCPSGDNPLCVRHLWLGTHAENMADRDAKGRTARGAKVGKRTLTADQVRDIRARWAAGTATQSALGREYGVTQTCIFWIVSRKNWSYI